MARPELEHAHPSGAVAGTFRPVDHAVVDVLMDDGTWGHAEAIGWAQDISRDWRIQLLYYDAGSQREDWWMYDPRRVRLVPDADPPADQLARPAQRLALAPGDLVPGVVGRDVEPDQPPAVSMSGWWPI